MESLERQINLVQRSRVDPAGCWLWTGGLDRDGYGRFGKRSSRAHRIAYEAFVGSIPVGLSVCHRCDVPTCINPHHLFVGTTRDNNADMTVKGGRAHGSRNGTSKLSDEDVRAIRRRYAHGAPSGSLAAEYGVTRRVIWLVATRRAWRHVA